MIHNTSTFGEFLTDSTSKHQNTPNVLDFTKILTSFQIYTNILYSSKCCEKEGYCVNFFKVIRGKSRKYLAFWCYS